MKLKLGNWAAGGEGQPEGTVTWAGGKTDFSQGPFDMYVKEVSIQNYNPADSYEYGDKSGSWQSIKINKDGSSSNAGAYGSTTSESESTATSMVVSNTTVPESSATADAYTSQASVQPLDQHTEAANSVTQTGSMYATNTASASALNSAISASTMETAISVTTQVPDSTPTDSLTGYGNSTATGNSTTHHGPSTSTPNPAEQTNSGASLKSGVIAGSVVGLALGVFML